jgi:transposase-like protein
MASLGTINAETMVFFRVLYAAPGHRLSRDEVIQEVARVVYPSRGFQSEMDRRRRKVPGYHEPKQGTRTWREILDAGCLAIATKFVYEKVRTNRRSGGGVRTPSHVTVEVVDGVEWITLTSAGVERAEALAKVPADAFERLKLDRSKKYEPSIDLGTLLRPLSETEYEELRDSIQRFGQLSPVVKDEGGLTIDGRNRERACAELGITPVVKVVPWDTSGDEKVAMCLSMNMARRQVSKEERAQIVLQLRQQRWTAARIAKVLGISPTTVSEDLRRAGTTALDGVASDGRTYYSEECVEQIQQLRATGMSYNGISAVVGVPKQSVARIVRRVNKIQPVTLDTDDDEAAVLPATPDEEERREGTVVPVPEATKQGRSRKLVVAAPESEPEPEPEPQGCVCPTCGGSGWVTP